MARKEFTFYGKTLEQLRGLSLPEFAKLLPSRERRSLTRGRKPGHEKVFKAVKAKQKNIKTHERDLIITPELVGVLIKIYDGRQFVPVEIQPEMLGHRLGEFALTRKKVAHSAPGIGATRSSAALSVR